MNLCLQQLLLKKRKLISNHSAYCFLLKGRGSETRLWPEGRGLPLNHPWPSERFTGLRFHVAKVWGDFGELTSYELSCFNHPRSPCCWGRDSHGGRGSRRGAHRPSWTTGQPELRTVWPRRLCPQRGWGVPSSPGKMRLAGVTRSLGWLGIDTPSPLSKVQQPVLRVIHAGIFSLGVEWGGELTLAYPRPAWSQYQGSASYWVSVLALILHVCRLGMSEREGVRLMLINGKWKC